MTETSTSSLREFLERRERELTHRASATRAKLAEIDAELVEIRRAQAALGIVGTAIATTGQVEAEATPAADMADAETRAQPLNLIEGVYAIGTVVQRLSRTIAEARDKYPFLGFEHLTIKQLIVKALTDHFPSGASSAELCEFIRDAYGRDIERSSLSPQLSRLKLDGVVDNDVASEPSEKLFVTKAFKSQRRRFTVGAEISVPDDAEAARVFTLELWPHNIDDLKRRGFVGMPTGGIWKLIKTTVIGSTIMELP